MNNSNLNQYDVENNRTSNLFGKLLNRYIDRWPYFLIIFLISICLSFIYLKYSKSIYELKASLIIKDKNKLGNEKTDLQQLDLANPDKKVEIEIEVLKSRALISKVINNLNLNISYKLSNNIKSVELYNSSPVKYNVIGKSNNVNYSFDIKILDSKSFQVLGKNKNEVYPFNEIFTTEYGQAIIIPTSFISNYLGNTIKINHIDSEQIINKFQDVYEARLIDKLAPIIELNIKDENIQRGKDFLNNIISEYNKGNTAEKNDLTSATLEFINKRLDSLSGELNSVEKNIEGYKSNRGLTDISSESNSFLQSMQSNNLKLNEVNVQLKIIEGIEKYINSPDNNKVPATIGIEDKGLINLIDQLSKLQLEKTKLLSTTPENNYLFVPINQQIKATVFAISQNVQNIKSSLLSIKNGLVDVNNNVESSIKKLPGEERGYISIKRQQSIKENLYTYLLQKREEIALSYASTLTDVNVIDHAYLSTIVWPKPPFIYSLFITFSFLFTALIIYILSLFNNKLKNVTELEDNLVLKPLALINNAGHSDPIVIFKDKYHNITQQFRSLRTFILHSNIIHNKKEVILITSAIKNEGKSFIATNLAISISSTGRKTIIVDLNLHNSKLSENFRIENNRLGVSDFLQKNTSLSSIILPVNEFNNLYIISAGTTYKEPSELIEDISLQSMFAELKDKFDTIIIDSPAIENITDAYIFSKHCTLSLFVVKKNVTKLSDIYFIKKLISKNIFPQFNIIYNGS